MADWNSELYLKFKKERTQPAVDLACRIRACHPGKVADIGCGPGNSTEVLKSVFPDSEIHGIDNSQDMIGKARKEHPELTFYLCDVNDIRGGYDVLFSNACLQWIPDHASLLPKLMGKLNSGGILAVQLPMNQMEPLFCIIDEVASDSRWGLGEQCFWAGGALCPDAYYDILSNCSSDFQMWETVYYHALPSHQALVDWIKGTRLRPYLEALDSENAAAFENEILCRAVKAYPARRDGNIILRFRRFFFVAEK